MPQGLKFFGDFDEGPFYVAMILRNHVYFVFSNCGPNNFDDVKKLVRMLH